MRRELNFCQTNGVLAEALGLDPVRLAKHEGFIKGLIDQDASLREIIVELNERGDLNDAEWTNAMYTLGWYTCLINNGVSYR